MKIKYETNGKKKDEKNISDIRIGTVFGGIILWDSVYLKINDIVVDLQYPQASWHSDMPQKDCVMVYNYKELDADVVVRGEK